MSSENSNTNLPTVPRHVAVIMDGNGRWARARGLARSLGHAEGVKAVRRITEAASNAGIKYLTLYTFSTENWNRPQEEVDALMHLIVKAIEQETPDLIANNVRLTMIGDRRRLPAEALESLEDSMARTAHCSGLNLVLALSYSSRWEITEAMRQMACEVADGTLAPEEIDEETLAAYLNTSDMPDPDLIIRTGGEKRLSNYLMWQAAYSELYFTDLLWPDFDAAALDMAIAEYGRRERRYGLTSDQISH